MLAPWKKSYDQPRQHINKQWHHFADKGPFSYGPFKAVVFPVVMYGSKSWTIKKAEYWRTDAFELWCCRRLLRVPWTAGKSNQSNLKEINSSEYSLEGPILNLKLQYFGHLMRRADSLENTDAGEDWGQEKGITEDERVGWHHRLNRHEFERALGDGEGWASLVCCSPWNYRVGHDLATEKQQPSV